METDLDERLLVNTLTKLQNRLCGEHGDCGRRGLHVAGPDEDDAFCAAGVVLDVVKGGALRGRG